jgi:large subunit ribosomal protein L22
MTKAQIYAKHNSARISPKKVAPVMDLVRGKDVEEAEIILSFDSTKAAKMILKVLHSAKANGKNNMNIDPAKLYVSDLHVSGGKTLKRGRFCGRGRFRPILKRTSHIVVGLSQRPMEGNK